MFGSVCYWFREFWVCCVCLALICEVVMFYVGFGACGNMRYFEGLGFFTDNGCICKVYL